MKRHSQILAGTALGLLMASAPLAALPLPEMSGNAAAGARSANVFDGRVIQAQAATAQTAEELRRLLDEGQITQEEYDQRLLELLQAPEEEVPAEEAPAEEAPAEEAPAEDSPAEDEAPEPDDRPGA